VKYKYTRRKVVWDVIRNLVNLGHTAQRAIDIMYDVYGAQTSVTDIINRMRRDKKGGPSIPTSALSAPAHIIRFSSLWFQFSVVLTSA
jgi:hypothetical protein